VLAISKHSAAKRRYSSDLPIGMGPPNMMLTHRNARMRLMFPMDPTRQEFDGKHQDLCGGGLSGLVGAWPQAAKYCARHNSRQLDCVMSKAGPMRTRRTAAHTAFGDEQGSPPAITFPNR
jgi:hypothetical protein